jgi:hypothetical protein
MAHAGALLGSRELRGDVRRQFDDLAFRKQPF